MHHGFAPFYREDSAVLILGSFPSVKSREQGFYYGHPRNRFWEVLAKISGAATPQTIDEKKIFLAEHRFALWDVIDECDITGSSDNDIRSARPCDITKITSSAPIRLIALNGSLASRLFKRWFGSSPLPPHVSLPSTSPANASKSIAMLIDAWRVIS